MKIEFFYFDGCPAWQEALENLKTALALDSLEAEIHRVIIQHIRRAPVPPEIPIAATALIAVLHLRS